ncbi:MAG: hypothetical protein K1W33_06415 [Clostridia bacterium]|nr:hypothetical protein [Clostridia bacterium]
MKKTIIIVISIILVIAVVVGGIFLIKNNSAEPKERKLQTVEEMQNMLNTIYSSEKVQLPSLDTTVIDVTDETQVNVFTGLKSNANVEELVVSVPFIGSQAYSLAVVKVSEGADIEQMKQEMLDNIDMRRWICVSAEKLYITNYENIIFLVMSSEDWAKPVYDEFKNFVENDIGKELEKSETEDIELPPEM